MGDSFRGELRISLTLQFKLRIIHSLYLEFPNPYRGRYNGELREGLLYKNKRFAVK